ncbi:MAG: VWA domain-containing protein [Candidatus Hydrogenedentota bacterium]|nr:MAG: VWA domain-containing protein [Candidatus Hydrogenedentota bacterium]
MTSGTISRHLHRALAYFLLTILIVLSSSGAHAQRSRDLIVVIDVSTSMSDIIDQAKARTKEFVSSAQLGDRVTIITFGKSARLLERARIRSSYDIARLLAVIDELEATEYATSLPVGMERGLREMRQFYEEDPEARRVLMWLSDEKSNPPKDVPNLVTFASLKRREAGQLPDHNWFAFEAPIKPETESDVRWFVDWASRSRMLLKVTLVESDLGTLLPSELEKELSIRFEPDTRAVEGTSFSVAAEVTDQRGAPYSAPIPVTPVKIVCRGSAWEEKIRVTFPDRLGSYVCRISFVLPSDKVLVISPPQVTLKAKVQPTVRTVDEHIASIDATIAADYERSRQEEGRTETALAPQVRARLKEETGQSARRAGLVFGPLVAGGRYQVSTSLFPTRNIPVDLIYMEPSFELPQGLDLRPEFRISEGTLVASLYLTAGEDLALGDGWEMQGTISFLSQEEGVDIYPADIPVRFHSETAVARWGRRELPVAATYEQIGKIWGVVKLYAVRAGKVLLVILAIWPVYYVVRRYGFAATELVGTLEIVRNPTDRKMKHFNLRRMGKLRATNSLTVGSSSKADVVLAHPSVADMHAKITTARTDAGVIVFVQPLHYKEIFVNDVAYDRRKEIGDKDILSIGEFVLLYRCPEIYRETIVRFADGRSIRGVLVSWDIDAPLFEFLPKGAPSLDARMVV